MSNFKSNLLGHSLGKGESLAKDDILNMVNVNSKYINSVLLVDLEKAIKTLTTEDSVARSLIFDDLKYKNDVELFKAIKSIVEDYENNVNNLKAKIDAELPMVILIDSENVNTRIALSLVSIGAFFAMRMPIVLTYLLDKNYTKTMDLTEDIFKAIPNDLMQLKELLSNGKKFNFKEIIDTIGKYPNLDFNNKRKSIPSAVVSGFIKSNFSSISRKAANFIKTSVTGIGKGKEEVSTGFVGNPIYHIRSIITDFEVNRYDRLKNMKKMTELKLLELSHRDQEDPTIEKQIEYYRNKLIKIDSKLDAILED